MVEMDRKDRRIADLESAHAKQAETIKRQNLEITRLLVELKIARGEG